MADMYWIKWIYKTRAPIIQSDNKSLSFCWADVLFQLPKHPCIINHSVHDCKLWRHRDDLLHCWIIICTAHVFHDWGEFHRHGSEHVFLFWLFACSLCAFPVMSGNRSWSPNRNSRSLRGDRAAAKTMEWHCYFARGTTHCLKRSRIYDGSELGLLAINKIYEFVMDGYKLSSVLRNQEGAGFARE